VKNFARNPAEKRIKLSRMKEGFQQLVDSVIDLDKTIEEESQDLQSDCRKREF
jgi:hypothetical protein